jgi:hypothetical protein
MKRATFDIDNKVLAGLIAGAVAFALTKLAIPLEPQLEQLINVAAALLAAYLVPSKAPSALTGELEEGDDIAEPPTSFETAALGNELALPEADSGVLESAAAGVAGDPDVDDELGDVPDLPTRDETRMWSAAEDDFDAPAFPTNGHGATATLAPPAPVETADDVDEAELYGEVNQTGFTDAQVADELETDALEDSDDYGPPPAPRI